MEYPDPPAEVLDKARAVCLALPEAVESTTSVGLEFKIRRRTFAYVFAIEDPHGREVSILVCRADPDEREVLLANGHPFFPSRSGADRIGVVLEDDTDWTEIAELVTDSYRLNAPRRLAALVDRPPT